MNTQALIDTAKALVADDKPMQSMTTNLSISTKP